MKNLMTTAILAFMSLITFGQLNQVTSNPTYDISLGDQIYLRYAVVGEENDVKVIKYDNNTNNITHNITYGSGIVTNHINHLEYGRFAIASQNQGLIVFGAYQENELFRINDTSYNGSNSYVNSAYANGHIMVTTGTDAKLFSFNEAEITIPVHVGSSSEWDDALPYITSNDSNFYYASGMPGTSNNMRVINHNLVQENFLEGETTRLNENYFKTCNYYNIQGEEYIIFALSGTYATTLYKISDGSFVSLYTGLAEKIVDTKIHPITNNIFGLLDNGTIYEITNSNDIVNETSNYFNVTGNVLNYTENANVNDFGLQVIMGYSPKEYYKILLV